MPSNIRLADVRKDLTNTDHVLSIHNVHVWSLTTGKTILSAHVVIGTLHLIFSSLYVIYIFFTEIFILIVELFAGQEPASVLN